MWAHVVWHIARINSYSKTVKSIISREGKKEGGGHVCGRNLTI